MMRSNLITLLVTLLAAVATKSCSAFVMKPGNVVTASSNAAPLAMGFLDGILGGGGAKEASASHILLTGKDASQRCEKLKMDIYKKAIGRGDPSMGVSADALVAAFGQQARSKSTCPSKKENGSLGTFGPGEMVPEFDQVVFKQQVGVIHGPVETQFGSHLILVTDRE